MFQHLSSTLTQAWSSELQGQEKILPVYQWLSKLTLDIIGESEPFLPYHMAIANWHRFFRYQIWFYGRKISHVYTCTRESLVSIPRRLYSHH